MPLQKHFEGGQAIIKVGGPGVLPRKILKKIMLAGASWFILRVNNYDCE